MRTTRTSGRPISGHKTFTTYVSAKRKPQRTVGKVGAAVGKSDLTVEKIAAKIMPPQPYLENVPGKPGHYRTRKEPLLPELHRYLIQDGIYGWTVHHKFVVKLSVDYPDRCADVNHIYRTVKERVDACEKELGDGNEYVFSHCRGYRFDSLVRIAKRLSPADYWRLVSRVWTDSENIRQNLVGWKRLWSAPVPEKHNAMDEEERAKLKSMPPSFDVWRGLGHPPFRRTGMSWTTNKDQALWFARRYQCEHSPGYLLHGRVKRRDVHAYLEGRMRAYLAGRNESEIVADNVKSRCSRSKRCQPSWGKMTKSIRADTYCQMPLGNRQ
jgi:hypothetical protein